MMECLTSLSNTLQTELVIEINNTNVAFGEASHVLEEALVRCEYGLAFLEHHLPFDESANLVGKPRIGRITRHVHVLFDLEHSHEFGRMV